MTQEQNPSNILKLSQEHLDQFKTDCLTLLDQLELQVDNAEDAMEIDGEPSPSAIEAELRKKIYVETVQLRELNWTAQENANQIKEATSQERNEVDQMQLDIQNIYYQHKHLKSEIERCNDFHSKHESLDMVPLEEFYERNPDAKSVEDPHALMLERLKDEEARRLDLFIAKTRLTSRKKSLVAENKKRKEDLEKLDAMLKDFIQSTGPIQKALEKY